MAKATDLTGRTFGNLKVIERAANNGLAVMWKCFCTICQSYCTKRANKLKQGLIESCGSELCCRRSFAGQRISTTAISKNADCIGQTFGFLYICELKTNEKRCGINAICNCKRCGRLHVVIELDKLKSGHTISCGCYRSGQKAKIAKAMSIANKAKDNYEDAFNEALYKLEQEEALEEMKTGISAIAPSLIEEEWNSISQDK